MSQWCLVALHQIDNCLHYLLHSIHFDDRRRIPETPLNTIQSSSTLPQTTSFKTHTQLKQPLSDWLDIITFVLAEFITGRIFYFSSIYCTSVHNVVAPVSAPHSPFKNCIQTHHYILDYSHCKATAASSWRSPASEPEAFDVPLSGYKKQAGQRGHHCLIRTLKYTSMLFFPTK